MNYPWKEAIINFVQTKNSHALRYAIEEIIDHYPKPALDVLMNLLDSHDTERIITKIGFMIQKLFHFMSAQHLNSTGAELEDAIQKLKIASFIQFTLPGVPSIYYGMKLEMQGFRDPYNRKTFSKKEINEEIFGAL